MPLPNLVAITLMTWVHRLGGPGLLLVALVDNSIIPLPGSVDIATVLLVSAHREWWLYYAAVAVVSSVLGGWLTFRLARKGGKETLEKEIGRERAEKVYQKFEEHGFSTIVIGAILPPPFPIVPVLMAAGVLEYPTRKFVLGLTVGRAVRYFLIAFLARIYGKHIIHFLTVYKRPMTWALILMALVGGIAALLYFKYYRPKRRREEEAAGEPVEDLPIPGQGNQELKRQKSVSNEKERRSA
jgi:membrane protein YqaA with SNARE-associated domain